MMAKLPEKRYASYPELIEHLNFALEKAILGESSPKVKKAIPVLKEKTELDWMATAFQILTILVIIAVIIAVVYIMAKK
jgi:hypothetical protein